MKLYWVKSPKWLRYVFHNYIWHFSPSSKVIYLTFDDGPTICTTNFILDCLQRYNAKATFFCIGKNAEKYPELMQRIQQEKHTIGNHTQNHLNGWKTSTKNYILDCLKAEEILKPYTGNNTKLFRAPYGKSKLTQQQNLLKKGIE